MVCTEYRDRLVGTLPKRLLFLTDCSCSSRLYALFIYLHKRLLEYGGNEQRGT